MSASKPRFFTLIEMLVVVAIIAILAALLAPSLQKALHRARGAACMGGPVKGIGTILGMYANDYNDAIPPTSGGGGKGKKWYLAFWDGGYIKNGLEMWCPSVIFRRDANWGQRNYYTFKGEIDDQAFGSMASAVYRSRDGKIEDLHQTDFYKFGKLKRPGKQIFAGDNSFNLSNPIGVVGSGYYSMRPSAANAGPASSNGSQGRVDARHANCAALVNFGGNAELFQFLDREQPWLNAPFGQSSSQEYRMRCTNNP